MFVFSKILGNVYLCCLYLHLRMTDCCPVFNLKTPFICLSIYAQTPYPSISFVPREQRDKRDSFLVILLSFLHMQSTNKCWFNFPSNFLEVVPSYSTTCLEVKHMHFFQTISPLRSQKSPSLFLSFYVSFQCFSVSVLFFSSAQKISQCQ
jgi:hypothetical protein